MRLIRYDVTVFSVVVHCACGWRELANDREEARRIALRHEVNVHPESRQVYAAVRIRAIRNAQQAERERRGDEHP